MGSFPQPALQTKKGDTHVPPFFVYRDIVQDRIPVYPPHGIPAYS